MDANRQRRVVAAVAGFMARRGERDATSRYKDATIHTDDAGNYVGTTLERWDGTSEFRVRDAATERRLKRFLFELFAGKVAR